MFLYKLIRNLGLLHRLKPYKGQGLCRTQFYQLFAQKSLIPRILEKVFMKKSPEKSSPLDGVCISRAVQNAALTQQFMDEFRLNGFCIPTNYGGGVIKKIESKLGLVPNINWFEKDQGGPMVHSGGRLGKLDAANEDGYFYRGIGKMKRFKEIIRHYKLKKRLYRKKMIHKRNKTLAFNVAL